MNIYLSHARKDSDLARKLARRLEEKGLTVFLPETSIFPGDNWAQKIGEALYNSDSMVFLVTQGSYEADWQSKDLQFALGKTQYAGRTFTVFVGPADEERKEVPWILLKQPHFRVESPRGFGTVARELDELLNGAGSQELEHK